MPYIPQEDRGRSRLAPTNPGELNFAVTSLIDDYMIKQGGYDYALLNSIVGDLEIIIGMYVVTPVLYSQAADISQGLENIELCDGITKIVEHFGEYFLESDIKGNLVSSAVGAVSCAKTELERVIIAEYEEEKREENGPVYTAQKKVK